MVIHPSYYDACDISCDVISLTVQNRTHVHINLFAYNHTYYNFPKYCRFLLNHPIYEYMELLVKPEI
jgi:hypothetical protein